MTTSPENYRCIPESSLKDEDITTQSESPWNSPKDCIWPLDDDDTRLCGGFHQCAPGYTCGSNWDPVGNPRFVESDSPYGFPRILSGAFTEDLNWGYTQFDNIGQSFVTIWQAVSEEGWTDIMYQAQDAESTFAAYIVFLLLILCGSFFMMNLFLAAIEIEDNDDEEGEEEGGEGDGKGNGDAKSTDPTSADDSDSANWSALHKFVESKPFGNFIILCILVNTVTLSMDSYPMDKGTEDGVEVVNMILTYVFIVEMFVKLPALGFWGYVADPFNNFDACIVTVSIVEIVADLAGIEVGAGGISALRTFRLFRIFKLARDWEELQVLLAAMVRTVYDIANFAVLLVLFMYIMALIGMQFFANEMRFNPDTGAQIEFDHPSFYSFDVIDGRPRNHFDTLPWALTTIFQFLSGENWNTIMYDCIRSTGWLSIVYTLMVMIIGCFIVMNLFLAILLANFEGNDDLIKTVAIIDTQTSSPDSKVANKSAAKLLSEGAKQLQGTAGDLLANIEGVSSESESVQSFQNVSLLFLKSDNTFRLKCVEIVSNAHFDNFIIFLIIFSSFTLAIDSPLNNPESGFVKTLGILDWIMTILFTIEMLLKIVALGFVLHKKSYLRNGWNVMDFLIVLVSWLALANIGPGKSLRALRTVRVLRPLRMVSRFPELKLVVDCLLSSIPAICNVAVICFLFFLIFAIVGVNQLKGRLYDCAECGDDGEFTDEMCGFIQFPQPWESDGTPAVFNNTVCEGLVGASADYEMAGGTMVVQNGGKISCECLGGSWENVMPLSFDDVGQALALLYEISTTEGWVDYMYAAVDSNGVGVRPYRTFCASDECTLEEIADGDSRGMMMIVFHVLFIVIGSFFIMSLFVGVVIDNFNNLKDEKGGGKVLMTEEQQEWANTKKFVMKLKPKRKENPPANSFRKTCHDIIMIEKPISFDGFIMGCILANSVVMAIEYHGMNDTFVTIVGAINQLFALIFTIEMVVKISALGPRLYISDGWNKFDCLIVIGTDAGLILYWTTGVNIGSVASVVRMCRIGRIFRLVNSFKALNHFFNTMVSSLPSLLNIGSLLFLLFFIYSVMAVQLFGKIRLNDDFSEHANFRNFGMSMVTLFRFSTGENWNGFMHDGMLGEEEPACVADPPFNPDWCWNNNNAEGCVELDGCGDALWAKFFFYTFNLTVSLVMLNLFLGVILDAFDENATGETLTPQELDLFCEDWCQFDEYGTGYMKAADLLQFMQILDEPMGFGEEYEASSAELWQRLADCGIMDIEVRNDSEEDAKEPKISIWEVAQALAKRVVLDRVGGNVDSEEEKNRKSPHHSKADVLTVQKFLMSTVNDVPEAFLARQREKNLTTSSEEIPKEKKEADVDEKAEKEISPPLHALKALQSLEDRESNFLAKPSLEKESKDDEKATDKEIADEKAADQEIADLTRGNQTDDENENFVKSVEKVVSESPIKDLPLDSSEQQPKNVE